MTVLGDKDPCKLNNGGCAHSCHQAPNGTVECLCEKGFKVVNEGHMCVGKYIIFIVFVKSSLIQKKTLFCISEFSIFKAESWYFERTYTFLLFLLTFVVSSPTYYNQRTF